MLSFVPHLRDLRPPEEEKYLDWLKQLRDMDRQSGFQPLDDKAKRKMASQRERVAILSLYLDAWLEQLAVPERDTPTLLKYTGARTAALSRADRNAEDQSHEATIEPAQLFGDAFDLAFGANLPSSKRVGLKTVLAFRDSGDGLADCGPPSNAVASDTDGSSPPQKDGLDFAEEYLAVYAALGCLICFSHSCEHGDYDRENTRRAFSISSHSSLSQILRSRSERSVGRSRSLLEETWTDHCHQSLLKGHHCVESRTWLPAEEALLRAVHTTASNSPFAGSPVCLVAALLNTCCTCVYNKYQTVALPEPQLERRQVVRVHGVPWYDRYQKALLGRWQNHTRAHNHQARELNTPCAHNGPCLPGECPCVINKALCDKFCGCDVESCAYKFTGCACHSIDKPCREAAKEQTCICILLNRECDPDLCTSCGVRARADPDVPDEQLLAIGCQNCDLQRGSGKSLVVGRSHLVGVGYGLFAAEEIDRGEFMVEYVGEITTHDDGVRRDARRGGFSDDNRNMSYFFTLLEEEGLWIDAAVYGNLSRYINHAPEHDKRRCNIVPKILYVNGEYRIKFIATRVIQAGEELFFDYGEYFPNLTETIPGNRGRSDRAELDDVGSPRPRPAPRNTQRLGKRGRQGPATHDHSPKPPATKKYRRRKPREEGSDDGEYRPTPSRRRT